MALEEDIVTWFSVFKRFISLNDGLGIWMIALAWRFYMNSLGCKVDIPENKKAFCAYAGNFAIAILLVIFGVLFIIALSNFAYIRLHARMLMICVMWYARRVVLELAIECGESFRYRDYKRKRENPYAAIDYKYEYEIFSQYKIDAIMGCIERCLYLCDELFILIKITFLLILFELFVEPFFKLAVRSIIILYQKQARS